VVSYSPPVETLRNGESPDPGSVHLPTAELSLKVLSTRIINYLLPRHIPKVFRLFCNVIGKPYELLQGVKSLVPAYLMLGLASDRVSPDLKLSKIVRGDFKKMSKMCGLL